MYTRIEAAGGARSIIEEPAIHAFSGYFNEVPRIINSVITNAFLLGAQLLRDHRQRSSIGGDQQSRLGIMPGKELYKVILKTH